MDMNEIVNVVLGVLSILVGALSLYLKTKAGLLAKAGAYIAQAEAEYRDATNAGGEKFCWVVDRLYSMVPKALQFVFTREFVGTMVQQVFDGVELYANEQINKAINSLDSRQNL